MSWIDWLVDWLVAIRIMIFLNFILRSTFNLLFFFQRKKVDSSSSSSDDDDEDAKADKNGQDDASKEPVRTHTELENIRLSRFRLAKWMYLPHFPDLVKGFFVRVNFGDMEQGKPIYKVRTCMDNLPRILEQLVAASCLIHCALHRSCRLPKFSALASPRDRTTSASPDRSRSWRMSHCVFGMVLCLFIRSVHSIYSLIDWLLDWLIDWLLNPFVFCWMIDWLIDHDLISALVGFTESTSVKKRSV